MKHFALVAVLLSWSASLFATDVPITPIAPGTYLLVYKDNSAGALMSYVKLTFAEQADKSLTVTSEKLEDMAPPAIPTPVIQRDGNFTFTLVYSFPRGNSSQGGMVTGTEVAMQTRTFFGWPDQIPNRVSGETSVIPGSFRGSMSVVGESGMYLGDFLLYRLPGK